MESLCERGSEGGREEGGEEAQINAVAVIVTTSRPRGNLISFYFCQHLPGLPDVATVREI